VVTRDILTKFSCLVFLCSLGKPWPLSSWAQIQSIRRLGENSSGKFSREDSKIVPGRVGEDWRVRQLYKIQDKNLLGVSFNADTKVDMSDYILDAEPGHIGSSNRNRKKLVKLQQIWLEALKNKTEMTWIPADDGLIAEDAPKKWRAGRYYKREQHAVICSRAVNVKYPCNVEFLSKSFKKFMTWHSPK